GPTSAASPADPAIRRRVRRSRGIVDRARCLAVRWSRIALSQPQPDEFSDLLGDSDFGREPLHRAGAVEAVNARYAFEDVLRILRRRDGSAVAEHEQVVADSLTRLGDRRDFADAIIQ